MYSRQSYPTATAWSCKPIATEPRPPAGWGRAAAYGAPVETAAVVGATAGAIPKKKCWPETMWSGKKPYDHHHHHHHHNKEGVAVPGSAAATYAAQQQSLRNAWIPSAAAVAPAAVVTQSGVPVASVVDAAGNRAAGPHCRFPWIPLAVIAGAIAVALAWIYFKNKKDNEASSSRNGNGGDSNNNNNNYNNSGANRRPLAGATAAAIAARAKGGANAKSGNGVSTTTTSGSSTGAVPPPPEPGEPLVVPIAATDADVQALKTPAVVMYTMNGCKYCVEALPELQKAATIANIPLYIVEKKDIAPGNRPAKGYPQIFMITDDGRRTYHAGHRTYNAFINWIRSHLENLFD